MSKEKETAKSVVPTPSVVPVPENPEIAELKAKLAKAEADLLAVKNAPKQKISGVKYTKPAAEGEKSSDGKGNLIKYVENEETAKILEEAGWTKA